MTLYGTTHTVGVLLHAHGTLRIFGNGHDGLCVEVIGFESDEGRAFLEALGGQLEDITADILVADRPELYGLDGVAVLRRLHWRRDS
jgi:hypothetical protein